MTVTRSENIFILRTGKTLKQRTININLNISKDTPAETLFKLSAFFDYVLRTVR